MLHDLMITASTTHAIGRLEMGWCDEDEPDCVAGRCILKSNDGGDGMLNASRALPVRRAVLGARL